MASFDDNNLPVGARIRLHRDRIGMSRPVLAGLVGRSPEWLKAVENGRLHPPRLPMLLRLARALGLADLADLTGNGYAVPVSVYAGPQHPALTAVQTALTEYRTGTASAEPDLAHLVLRLDQAWRIRHASPDHRTQLGALLPGLIRDAQSLARNATGDDRRSARKLLSGVYQLTDFYVAYQPAPELVWLVADRALAEAYEADDPFTIGGATWAMVQALRDAGRWEEALALADSAIRALTTHLDSAPPDWHGMVGALEAEVAYVYARRGRYGDAWRHWERADRIATTLGPDYRHTQSSFSQPVMAAHATTLGVELHRPGEALRAAAAIDPATIASVPRRSRHLIETARAESQREDHHAALALLEQAAQVAPETIRYNGFARDIVHSLVARPPAGTRDRLRDLERRIGLAA
ncbi:helix-turn-helix domain-containing protein [Nocardia sp. CWNU-33]|uniref:helix-turn-helix domain-containing protein n=1 Tax=Nocardia sp. CWNU-33 TaxID=3392117 RepID=UPI00398E45F6